MEQGTKRTIVTYPDPCLKQPAEPVCEITEDIRQLARDMVTTMYESEGIGLAAPQLGECVRLIVVDVTGPDNREDLKIIVNPKIVVREGEIEHEEGCLSCPGLRSIVQRAEKVRVTGQDLDGREQDIQAEGLLAICLQHEIDHLDGILFIDRISRLKRSLYDQKVKKWIKRKQTKDE